MGRRNRSHHPGMIFHLVSRTHRREPWFTPKLRPVITEFIREMVGRTDAHLLAYAVMPNHLHIIVRQGKMRLGEIMQPLMRRIALRVQRLHDFEGSVVERRFRDTPCAFPDHIRMAIVYVHLNPWRAGLCDDGRTYPWTSFAAYLPGADPTLYGIHPEAQERVLGLFADREALTRDELASRYLAFQEWRMSVDRYQAAGEAVDPVTAPPLAAPPPKPSTAAGDVAWHHHFPSNGAGNSVEGLVQPDLRDFVRALLSTYEPTLTIGLLRGSWRPRSITRLRARLIRAAADRGFRTGEIARFFAISPQTVSRAKYER